MPTGPPTPPATSTQPANHGDALRERAESTSRALCQALATLHAEVLPLDAGPKKVADLLGQPVPMASRILKALAERTPLGALQRLPGPEPLRRWIRAAASRGAGRDARRVALEAVDAFERMIADEAGDRAALDARLIAWMPEARRTLELRRRQSIFRGLSELDGRYSQLDATTILLHPSRDGAHVDLCVVQSRTGMVALRPDLPLKFVTERLTPDEVERHPSTLDGVDLTGDDGRLGVNAFIQGTPAETEVVRDGERVQYLLRPPAHAPGTATDFVLAEVNRDEFERSEARSSSGIFFTQLVQSPCRHTALDVLMHRDLVPAESPELLLYRNYGETQARPGDPLREVDRIDPLDDVERLVGPPTDIRVIGFPRYGEMLDHVARRLDWDLEGATMFRARMEYPVPGTQLTLRFRGTSF